LPDYEKQGIDKSLVNNGLSLLKDMGGKVADGSVFYMFEIADRNN